MFRDGIAPREGTLNRIQKLLCLRITESLFLKKTGLPNARCSVVQCSIATERPHDIHSLVEPTCILDVIIISFGIFNLEYI